MSRGKQCLPFRSLNPTMVTYHHEVASIPFGEVFVEKMFGFSIGGPTDELHPFTKSSETDLG